MLTSKGRAGETSGAGPGGLAGASGWEGETGAEAGEAWVHFSLGLQEGPVSRAKGCPGEGGGRRGWRGGHEPG